MRPALPNPGARIRRLLPAALMLLTAADAWSGMKGTAHDFKGRSWNTSGETCLPCHSSHVPQELAAPNARLADSTPQRHLPLWNRRTTTAAFKLYRSETMDATPQQPSTSSKLCLSCHDGTVALNSFGGKQGNQFMEAGPANLGTDLSNDHPISIRYDSALAAKDKGLYNPSARQVPAMGGKSVRDALLVDDQVECSSCHDVHGERGQSRSAGKLLIVNNAGSALCLTCHNK